MDLNDPKVMRALAVECLQRDGKHAFLQAADLTQQIDQRIAILPEYKRHRFTDRYGEVDAEFLREALHLHTKDEQLFVYFLASYEDERRIEKALKFPRNR